MLRELDGERAGRCCLSDTALATYEDPSQRLLVKDGLERGLHVLGLRVELLERSSGRHRDGGAVICGS